MITNTEFNISNQTYTKKDFYQVYPEILELVTKITERWDPTSSNESDPGVVLLKLLAFIADKNNYNIDKNVLECFMPSCTQEESMRKLCDMMGYNMQYHQSATTEITFMYQGSELPKDSSDTSDPKYGSHIYLPAFTTVVSNVDGDLNYVLTQEVVLEQKYEQKSANAIEGTYCEVQIGSDSTENVLKLINLNDQLRFYLPETQIAENGIWVRYKGSSAYDEWTRVDNLNTQIAGSKVFKFGFDSKRKLPYIEFPKDITDLIKEGLQVSYVRTNGINGNASTKTLTELANATEVDLYQNGAWTTTPVSDEENVYLVLSNLVAAVNGRDSETLDEAYNGFKKTVGTFDTLVTCRDYANAIYGMVSANDNTTPLVSDAIVSDIRDDLNNSYKIMTFNNFGICYIDTAKTSGGSALIDNFDLIIYPFKNITGAYNSDTFQDSFRYGTANIQQINEQLEDYKTISHTINYPNPISTTEVFCIKNYYGLNAKITTTYKVNKAEEKIILENVYKALYERFNCRNVDFGEELVYDEILKTIEEADVRIKNVTLDDPEIETWSMSPSGAETPLFSGAGVGSNAYEDFIVKNILAGRLKLFSYFDDFSIDYGYIKHPSYSTIYGTDAGPSSASAITVIDTKAHIAVGTLPGYTLPANTMIDFIAPNLVDKYIYPAYVNYFFKAHEESGVKAYVPANTSYALSTDTDTLYAVYTDSSKVVHAVKYFYDTVNAKFCVKEWQNGSVTKTEFVDRIILKPNFELLDTVLEHASSTKAFSLPSGIPSTEWTDVTTAGGMFKLDISETITMRDFNFTTLNSTSLVYWYTKNGNIPLDNTTNEYILEEGEYFFYTNTAKTELVTLGSGTKIKAAGTAINTLKTTFLDEIDLSAIAEGGIAAFSDVPWVVLRLNTTNYVELWEMKIISLTENDTVNSITFVDTSLANITGDWKDVSAANYTIFGEAAQDLPALEIATLYWKARSRLALNVGPEIVQRLYANQQIVLKHDSTTLVTFTGSNTDADAVRLKTNYLVQNGGGIGLSAKRYTTDGVEIDDLKFLVFKISEPTDQSSQAISIMHNYDNKYTKFGSAFTQINLPLIGFTNNDAIVMLYVEQGGATAVTLNAYTDTTATSAAVALRYYNGSSASWLNTLTLHAGINVVEIQDTAGLLRIVKTAADVVTLGDLQFISTTNSGVDTDTLGLNATGVTNVLTKIRTAVTPTGGTDLFYYNAPLDPAMLIDTGTSGTMKDPLMWYDYNNVCNKFVISELDVSTFDNITLTKASRQ